MFSTHSDNCIPFVYIFDIISSFAAEFEEPKIGISGKGLRVSGAIQGHHGPLVSSSEQELVRVCCFDCAEPVFCHVLSRHQQSPFV